MSAFDDDDALRRYRRLIRRSPGLFPEDPEAPIAILTEVRDIARAQAAVVAARRASGTDAPDVRVGILADDPYVTLVRDAVRFEGGKLGLYNRVLAPGGVVIMPIMDRDLLLIRIYRHATRSWFLEFPAGGLSPDEPVEATARRELREEIQADAEAFVDLGIIHTSNGMTAERLFLLACRVPGFGRPETAEAIRSIERHSVEQVEAMIARGDITDTATIAALYRARLKGVL
jgi:ADP-ribose pyrophosphatase